jgi:3-oxoacyl-[acyl-carrier protein] reductase
MQHGALLATAGAGMLPAAAEDERGKETPGMDLGIKGKTAIVCAASKGLGRGCAEALARDGVDVTICARGADALNATAKELAAYGSKVTPVVCDVTTEEGRKTLLAACPNPDILR